MNKRKLIIDTCVMILVGVLISLCCIKSNRYFATQQKEEKNGKKNALSVSDSNDRDAYVRIWYTNPDIEGFLSEAATEFEKDGITLSYELKARDSIIEEINNADITREDVPDLYIIPSEELGKAYLAGLTKEVSFSDITGESEDEYNLSSGIYEDVLSAIPLYFEEPVFIYNKDYVKDVPKTFDDILAYADEFDGESYPDVKQILKWDVKELQYNYGFVGEYISYGGPNGDDESVKDICNNNAYNALNYYASLKDYFSIDLNNVDYNKTLNEFAKGQVVFTIANIKDIDSLYDVEDGKITKDNIGIIKIPDMTGVFKTKTLSFTDVLCVNPYGDKYGVSDDGENLRFDLAKGDASLDSFLKKLITEESNLIEKDTDYIPFYKVADDVYYEQYQSSIGLPKLVEASGFYVSLEVAMGKVWNGTDAKEAMEELYESLK